MAGRRHRARRWVVAGVAVVVVVAVGGPFVFIHFIEGPAPAKLSLPKNGGGTRSATAAGAGWRRWPVPGRSGRGPPSATASRRY